MFALLMSQDEIQILKGIPCCFLTEQSWVVLGFVVQTQYIPQGGVETPCNVVWKQGADNNEDNPSVLF